MKIFKIESIKRYLKRSLKGKVRITISLICMFLLSNVVRAETTDTTQQKLQELEKIVNELKAKVLGSNIIFGKNAKDQDANGKKNSVILGENALNKGQRSIVIGTNAKNNMIDSNTDDNTKGKEIVDNIVIGTRAKIEWKNGKNIVQSAIAIGTDSNVESDTMSAIAIGQKTKINEGSIASVALGLETNVKGKYSLGIGRKTLVEGQASVAIGSDDSSYKGSGRNKEKGTSYPKTKATGDAATAIGAHAQAKNKAATAIGAKAFSLGEEATAIGANALASEKRGVAIGYQADAKKENSIAIGTDATASLADGVAIGSNSVASRDSNGAKFYDFINNKESSDAKLDEGKKNSAYKIATKAAVSIGNVGSNITRQLTDLAAGSEDTDAVNVWQVKQLKKHLIEQGVNFATDNKADGVLKLGEDGEKLEFVAKTGDDNNTAKTWKHGLNNIPEEQKDDYSTENTSTHYDEADGKKKIFIGIKENPNFKSLKIDGDIELTKDKSNNLALNNKKLTGLADGEVSENSTDAISGKVLHDTLDGYAKRDASNLDSGDSTTNRDKWIEKLGATTITSTIGLNGDSSNGKLITEKAFNNFERKFAGDDYVANNDNTLVKRKFSDTLKIIGGAIGKTTAKNIKVERDADDTLKVKLASDLKDINSIELKTNNGKGSKKIELETDIKQNLKIVTKNGNNKIEKTVATKEDIKFKYKSSTATDNDGKAERSLDLTTDGNDTIDFKAGNNLTSKTTQGSVEFGLKDSLTGINSVSGGGTNNKSKITLGENDLKLTHDGADLTLTKVGDDANKKVKISGVADATDDYDAVNKKQLDALKNIVATGKINIIADNNNYDLGLGEKLEFITNKTGQAAQQGDKTFSIGIAGNQKEYSTKNLATHIENDDTKKIKKLFVGISENPEFNTIKVGTKNNTVSLSGTATGLSLGSKKLENVANGTIGENSTDAVTGKQVNDFVKELEPKETQDNEKIITVEKEALNNGGQKYKLGINETNLINKLSKDANIASPTDGSNKLVTDKQVNEAIIGAKTIVKHGDNETIVQVSPKAGTNGITANEYTVTVDKEKITELIDVQPKANGSGMLEVSSSVDTNTKKKTFSVDLSEETKQKIDGALQENKAIATYAKIDGSNLDGTDVKEKFGKDNWTKALAANSIRDSISGNDGNGYLVTEKAVKEYVLNQGIKFTTDNQTDREVKLGTTIDIIGKDTNYTTKTWKIGPNNEPDKQFDYSTENTSTFYEGANGKKQIFIGIKENPNFKTLKINEDITLSKNNGGNLELNSKKLTGLADGEINETSTDAVTGKQLHSKLNDKADKTSLNFKYKSSTDSNDANKTVEQTLSLIGDNKTLDFQAEDNLTSTVTEGVIKYGLKSTLTDITSISGGKGDAPNNTADKSKIEFTKDGLKLIHDGAEIKVEKDTTKNGENKAKITGLSEGDISSTTYGVNGNVGTVATQKEVKDVLDNQTITYAIKDGNANVKVIKKGSKFYKVKPNNGGVEELQDSEKEKVFLATIDETGAIAKPMTLSNIKNTLGNDNYTVTNLITENDTKKLSNAASIKDLQELAKAGITFEANFGADKNTTNGNTVAKKLGETISITANGIDSGKLTRTRQDGSGVEDHYTGDNLATYVKEENGQKKIFIGMKEDSKFKSLTIGGTDFGNDQKEGKGKITADDNSLTLGHDNANIKISKADGENGANPKAKITGLKDNDVNSDTYGTLNSGIAATQKEVKDVLNKTKAVQDGTSGTVIYTKKDGTRLIKENGRWYEADDNGMKKDPSTEFTPNGNEDIILSLVNKDGSTKNLTSLGNIKSALGLQDTGEDGNASSLVAKLVNKDNGNNKFTDRELSQATNLNDLRALAKAGITFAGNTGISHKNLGETISIVGGANLDENKPNNGTTEDENAKKTRQEALFKEKYNSENVATMADSDSGRVTIAIAKNLKKVNSIESEANDTNKEKTKLTLSKDGAEFKVLKEKTENGQTTTEEVGATTKIGKDGIDITKKGGNSTKPQISIKAGDDTNGPSIDFETTDGANGKEGKGSISGLKDLDDSSAGHMAANKNYVDKKFKTVEDKVNNIKFTFKGNSGTKEKKSGEEVSIKGTGADADTEEKFTKNYSSNNIATKVDTTNGDVIIGLANKLKEIESLETKEDNGKKSKLDNSGLSVENTNSKANYGADKIEFKSNDNKPTLTLDGNKKQLSGLADLKDTDDGSLAANKNYVDSKIGDLKDSNPFEYFKKEQDVVFGEDGKVYPKDALNGKKYDPNTKKWTNEDGTALNDQPTEYKQTKLVKGKDNKFYTEDDLKNKTWDKANNKYKGENGEEASPYTGEVVIKAMPNEKPLTLGNVANGRIEKNSTDAINGGQLFDELEKKLNLDGSNIKTLNDAKALSKNISKHAVLEKGKDTKEVLVTDKQVKDYLDTNYLDADTTKGLIRSVDKKADTAIEKSNLALGGVANAVAMANLVQVNSYSDYRHNLSAAYGYYGGSHALAIGFSGVTENRRFAYKLSGAVNNQGNLALGIGAGIMLGEKEERYADDLKKLNVKKLHDRIDELEKDKVNDKKEIENLRKENHEIKETLNKILKQLSK